MELDDWFTHLWHDYAAIAPRVSSIRHLLEERGEKVEDDHVAFRTLNLAPIGLDQLDPVIRGLGFEPFDDYVFEQKKLRARSYSHADGWPRVFLSELLVEEMGEREQEVLRRIASQIPETAIGPDIFWAGVLWDAIPFESYEMLQASTEYGAWFSALGLRPNHFTVNVNSLDSFNSLDALLDFVLKSGFDLNESGGRVKGSPEVFLEQGSTMADRLDVTFSGDTTQSIPTCYYEFALRHPTEDGQMYDGFVATSADRIFESTDARS